IQDTDFYRDYLQVEYVKDNTGVYILEGVSGDPISDGMTVGISDGDGADSQYWPSEIAPVTAYATEVFNYRNGGCAAARVDTGTYKVVYFAFGFEAINSSSDRDEIMRRVLSELTRPDDATASISRAGGLEADGSESPEGPVWIGGAKGPAKGAEFEFDLTIEDIDLNFEGMNFEFRDMGSGFGGV
ncbi:hypothetical protein, partial [Methanocrinis sp.]|uniref:hypothetical protein n=1 Tax=Methanocrinis sp. TaxID=3101522 RepID=UPI003D0C1689